MKKQRINSSGEANKPSGSGIGTLLSDAVRQASSRLRSPSCAIFLVDGDQMLLRAATDIRPDLLGKVGYGPGEGLTGHVLASRKPLVVADVRRDIHWMGKFDSQLLDQSHIPRALAACPIVQDGVVFGVLRVSRDAPYSQSDLEGLNRMAAGLASTLVDYSRKEVDRRELEPIYKPDIVRIELISAVNTAVLKYLKAHPEEIHRLDPIAFEELIAEILKREGWKVRLTLPSRDGGYDMVAVQRIGGVDIQLLAEAKRYRADRPVGVGAIRQLWAVKQRHHASKALLATTSYVSGPAKSEFQDVIPYELEIKEYDSLVAWLSATVDPNSDRQTAT